MLKPKPRWGVRYTSDPTKNEDYLQLQVDENSDYARRGEIFLNESLAELYYKDSEDVVKKVNPPAEVYEVETEEELLTLELVRPGDFCIVSSTSTLFILSGYPSSEVLNWQKIGVTQRVKSSNTIEYFVDETDNQPTLEVKLDSIGLEHLVPELRDLLNSLSILIIP